MTSQRHSDDLLLDAARHCVLSVGVRRTTLTDIARRAGTSRMTVYRRFPGVTSVVAALMTREFGALLGEISAAADGVGADGVGADGVGADGVGADGVGADGVGADGVGADGVGADGLGSGGVGSARGRLVAAAVRAVERLVRDPLLTSVLDRDAELLLPYLVERIGSTQRLAEKFITELLVAGHADGSIRVAPVGVQARLFFLTVQAFVLSNRPATADVPAGALLVELGVSLDHGLRPGGRT